jgi:ribosomal protein L22
MENKDKKVPEEKKKLEEKIVAEAEKKEEKPVEKPAEKKEKKKEGKKDKKEEIKKKKTEALVYGKDLTLSTKHCVAICDFIRGKKIDTAISLLGEVLQMKRAVPMKGEIPHRKGRIMSGRYPLKACKQFVKLLQQLAANATVNEIEIEKWGIECKANKAARPYKRFGNKRFKRTHVTLKLNTKPGKKKKKKSRKKK